MLKIVQSQDIERLFQQMLVFFDANPIHVFESRQILVPSHGVGVWLKLQLANQHGIAAQVATDFLGAFQWELYGRLTERESVDALGNALIPAVPKAPLSTSLMRWQIFNYIWQVYQPAGAVDAAARTALDFLLKKIVVDQHHGSKPQQAQSNELEVKAKVWALSEQIAQVFAGYATYRPEWLLAWGRGEVLDLHQPFQSPAQDEQPDWLRARYAEMQIWQAWLWKTLFAETFVAREAEIASFWSRLAAEPALARKLPSNITIFTVIQLPPAALLFVRQLAQYVDVLLLHYNPSQEYWADLVDSRWLQRRISERAADALGRDTHPLLTRMGKQARDVFKLLVGLSGGEYTPLLREVWSDDFSQPLHSHHQPQLLQQIQQHALDLSNVSDWLFAAADQSLLIHACHSTLRQLEVLREEIIQWLGGGSATDHRLPADILILLPDIAEAAPLIEAVFSATGSKGSGEVSVPYEITGLASPDVDILWQSLLGRFHLLAGRLPCEALLDWLALAPVQASYGISPEQVTRMGELLVGAGFRRGFDAAHLSRTLSQTDVDVRFTLRFALDRLILGMAMPVATLYADCLPVTTLLRDDFELIAILQQVYEVLAQHREQLHSQRPVVDWLALIKQTLQDDFAEQRDSRGWSSILMAITEMEKSALAAEDHGEFGDGAAVRLPLRFILEELAGSLEEAVQSSVPTGRVTFARLGTLRPLPYRVIAVLNLDTGKFPKREQKNTFDLIGAFPSKLGDRSRAEDDLGAFLDALLLARDACWLFYNGQDVQDDQPRLPAAPVQELMDFLRSHLALLPDTDPPSSPLDRYIHRPHSLLPFERENFAAPLPASGAGVWFEVAERLSRPAMHPLPWLADTSTLRPIPDTVLSAEQWIKDLLQPARYFLAEARIGRLYLDEGLNALEPLTLNKLDEYQLRNDFQAAKQTSRVLTREQWVAALPIGVAGDAYWLKGEFEQQLIAKRLAPYGTTLTPVTERLLQLGDPTVAEGIALWQLSIRVPTDSKATLWLAQSASSGRGKHRLRFWLEHLLWQVQRQTTVDDVAAGRGQRVCVYSKETMIAEPILAADACGFLLDWLHLWQRAAKTPLVLPPALALEAFKVTIKDGVSFKEDIDGLIEKWMGHDFNSYTSPQQNEDCALHSDWQLILQGQDPADAFERTVRAEAEHLYRPLLTHTAIAKKLEDAA
jgi:exodeoxyribonuclease V gamma subunit